MSVKVENRPENRFTALVSFSLFQEKLLQAISSDNVLKASVYRAELEHQLIKACIKCRADMQTFNRCYLYNEETFSQRVVYQMKAFHSLETIRAALETFLTLTGSESVSKYTALLNMLPVIENELIKLQQKDSERHAKGKRTVAKEFEKSRQRDFYEPKRYDHAQTDPKLLKNNDPFKITDLAFKLKDTASAVESSAEAPKT